jgi:predicted dehydrogenase
MFTVGIIGCGDIGVPHAEATQASQLCRVSVACDINPDVAAAASEKLGVPFTLDADEVFANPDVHIVYVAVPHYLHTPLTVQAARAGKHVVVEKPIATSVKDAQTMIQACKDAGVTLSVCYVMRYREEILIAREVIAKGCIGQVIGAHVTSWVDKPETYWTGGYSRRSITDWRASQAKSGGGVLMMNAIHNVDAVRWITGLEVVRVYAEMDTFATPVEVEDTIAVTLRYGNGAIGTVRASSCVRGGLGGSPQPDRIFGDKGQLILDDPLRLYSEEDTEFGEAKQWLEIPPRFENYDVRTRFMDDLAWCLQRNRPAPVTGEDGLESLRIIAAAYESAEKRQPVEL